MIYQHHPPRLETDFEGLFNRLKPYMSRVLKFELGLKQSISVGIVVHVEFQKIAPQNDGNPPEIREFCIRGKNELISARSDIPKLLKKTQNLVSSRIESHNQEGSGLIVKSIPSVDIQIGRCPPLNGYCDFPKIVLPKNLAKIPIRDFKKGEVGCFALAIAQFFTKSMSKQENIRFAKTHFEGRISGGMKVSQIDRFEKKNPHLDLGVNVLFSDGNDVYPLIRSNSSAKTKINLLFYQFRIGNRTIGHYHLIEDLNKFCQTRYLYGDAKSKYSYYKGFRCPNCLHRFGSQSGLNNHLELCGLHKPQLLRMPAPTLEDKVMFRRYGCTSKAPITIFFDFEATNTEKDKKCKKCDIEGCSHKTINMFSQIPFCYGVVIVSRTGDVLHQNVFVGENAAEVFLAELLDLEESLLAIVNEKFDLNMSQKNEQDFQDATKCHICDHEFKKSDLKVRDHDHLNGKFLGAAHNLCNLLRKETKLIPVLSHNMTGYDSHFIIKALKNDPRIKLHTALASNSQKMKTFKINCFRFCDTLDFLQGSLDKLVKDLSDTHTFPILNQSKLAAFSIPRELLTKKGVYPYEFAKSLKLLKKTKKIPDRSSFYSHLTNETATETDYMHACQMFDLFKCQNMLDYTQCYCLLDVFLLAEAFFAFREEIYREIGLDCVMYVSLPQLAYDSMLKKSKIKIQLVTDIDQFLFIENGIRGGLSFISQRYAEKTKKKSDFYNYLAYIDANNLYGSSQTKPLPVGNYRWLTKDEISAIRLDHLNESDNTGYMLEVDLDYPKSLHVHHNSFPLAPEKITVTAEMMSDYSINSFKKFHNTNPPKTTRLTATLNPRKKYVVHYMTLKTYLSLGMILKKIHRVLAFKQEPFMTEFIDFCTEKRVQSQSDFKKRIWKLFVNSCFGKFIESVRRYKDCSIITTEQGYDRAMKNPRLDSMSVVSETCVIALMTPSDLFLNKPIAVGMTILDRSKDFMYRSFYERIKPKFPICRILFSDTDSLCMEIQSNKPIHFNETMREMMDFSNYHPTSKDFSKKNQNRLFFFKDECAGHEMIRFVGLRAKSYAFETSDKKVTSKLKGITKAYKKTLNFQKYLKCLRESSQVFVTQYHIRSRTHQVTLDKVNRLALTCYDANRYILPCGIHTFAYGHHCIKYVKQSNFCVFCEKTNPIKRRNKSDNS